MKLMKIVILTFVLAVAGLFFAVNARGQSKPTDQQKDEIQKVLDKIKQAEKDGKTDDVKKLKKEAIRLADKYYKIPQDNVDGEPEYDPGSTDDGDSEKSGKKVKVTLGEPAFTTPGWLASTKLHEIVGHGGQAASDHWYRSDKGNALNEIEAYDLEIKNAETTGLSKDEIDELKKRRQEYYDELSDANKAKVDKGNYVLALAPAAGSTDALAGKGQVFVAGTVLAEDNVPVTVRGPRTLEGLVISVEAGGRKTESHTDAQGRSTINFAPLLAGSQGATEVTVRVLDSAGNVISHAQTRVQPGRPQFLERPQISNLPRYVRNRDVVTIPGRNLGAEAQLVIGDRLQETLSASSRELTAFVEAPVGAQPVFVLTPTGESQSQTVHCYTFSIHASKPTITRGEHVTATAQYEGLPPGAEIVFTNASPGVVKMNARGAAQNAGQTATIKVSRSDGTVALDLVGESSGGFVINYDVRFPE